MIDYKIFYENRDYLQKGWTFEKIKKLLENKAVPLTKEALAEIVSEEALNITEDDLIDYLTFKSDNVSLLPKINFRPSQYRMTYAEDLEKNDELNQDFPEPEDK